MDDFLFSYAEPSFPPLKRGFIRLVERVTGQPHLKRLYGEHRANPVAGESFFQSAVRRLDLTVAADPDRLAAVPREGPLVIVANHPFGVLDGIVICWLIEKVRSDFLVLTNSVLLRAPEVAPYLLPVDFTETEAALATNLATRAAARRHLDAGGCIVVFPAGGVATAPDRLGRQRAIDAVWQPFTSQLIQRSRASVVPFFFAGQNSRLFQIASHINQAFRLSLIFKEVHDRIGTTVPVAVGGAIRFEEIAHLTDRRALTDELRRRTDALGALFADADWRPVRRRRPRLGALKRLPRKLLRRDREATRH